MHELEQAQTPLWISRQVIREYLATLIRPRLTVSFTQVLDAARAFERRYQVAEETAQVTPQLTALLALGLSTQVHDTNIVATMLTHNIPRILTNNPDDFAPYQSMIEILPLT